MSFDWEHFLDSHHIDSTRDRRYHLTRHHIGINCPFCGDDTGYNLGINVRNGFWHCWREPVPRAHSGRAPYRLIEALLGCSRETSRLIVKDGDRTVVASDLTFGSDIARRLGRKSEVTHAVTNLEFPDGYYPLNNTARSRRMYYPYLAGRGYTEPQIDWLVERYQLCYAARGPFVYRVIVPVYYQQKLVTWTGRHIGDDELRYRTLSHHPESALRAGLPQAVVNIKHVLLDYDMARYGGRILVVTEGPFDAMRVTMLGYRSGIHAVALFGKQASGEQLDLLAGLIPRYRHAVSLLDADATHTGFSPFPERLNIKQRTIPDGVKDPALLTREQFARLFAG